MSPRLCFAAAALGCVVLSTTPDAAAKRLIAETVLFKFTWIANPQISADGATVAFVKAVVDEKAPTGGASRSSERCAAILCASVQVPR